MLLKIVSHSFTISYIIDTLSYQCNQKKCKASFNILVVAKHLSKANAQRLAGSGLLLQHLKLAYARGGVESVVKVLAEKDKFNQPRVNWARQVALKIHDFL